MCEIGRWFDSVTVLPRSRSEEGAESSGKGICQSAFQPSPLVVTRGRKTLMQAVEMSFLHQAAVWVFVMNNKLMMIIFLNV